MLFICKLKNYAMKKLFPLLFIFLLFFAAGCKKNSAPVDNSCNHSASTIVAPLSEQQALQDSLTAHDIQATKDSSGFFYKINKPGSGDSVSSLCTTIAVYYRGGFLNGKGFDSTTSTPAVLQLWQVIPAWQKAIPLIAKNGDISLYIPPSLGYGPKDVKNPSTGAVVIPANSNLVFRVVIADIQ